ncbi:hypothetical protein GWI33_001780 [Rhynchophorus ferrugineus]|uniref:Uncharacterized protein n=1 Tax=Rhynchophorus ferrugineus TaxID=354439 RepID=A0A834ISC6_RHYFE|nr:hypothetical protein GWI33_001780 [Rhynchophorus ferrugineus]
MDPTRAGTGTWRTRRRPRLYDGTWTGSKNKQNGYVSFLFSFSPLVYSDRRSDVAMPTGVKRLQEFNPTIRTVGKRWLINEHATRGKGDGRSGQKMTEMLI